MGNSSYVCLLLGVFPATVNTRVNAPSPGTPSPVTVHTLGMRVRPAIPVSLTPHLFFFCFDFHVVLFSFSLFCVYLSVSATMG